MGGEARQGETGSGGESREGGAGGKGRGRTLGVPRAQARDARGLRGAGQTVRLGARRPPSPSPLRRPISDADAFPNDSLRAGPAVPKAAGVSGGGQFPSFPSASSPPPPASHTPNLAANSQGICSPPLGVLIGSFLELTCAPGRTLLSPASAGGARPLPSCGPHSRPRGWHFGPDQPSGVGVGLGGRPAGVCGGWGAGVKIAYSSCSNWTNIPELCLRCETPGCVDFLIKIQ